MPATYPTLDTDYGSDPDNSTGLKIDRAEDGTARGRSYGGDKARIKVVHRSLDSADKATLDAFYATNRLLAITYVSPSDSVSRTCIFAAAPTYKREPGTYWTAAVLLEEV